MCPIAPGFRQGIAVERRVGAHSSVESWCFALVPMPVAISLGVNGDEHVAGEIATDRAHGLTCDNRVELRLGLEHRVQKFPWGVVSALAEP